MNLVNDNSKTDNSLKLNLVIIVSLRYKRTYNPLSYRKYFI